ncbi:MAG: XRE family transcriptional regulator, partial [Leptolyngbya sp. SIO3F4]|nr:XRE family transcriptional regulator [Leptolyngbya sp. SIO3F4]
YWNQLDSNQAAQHLFEYLINSDYLVDCCSSTGQINLMKMMFHPQILRPWVINWEAAVTVLSRRVHREAVAAGEQSVSAMLFQELLGFPDVRALWQSNQPEIWHVPLLTVDFEKYGQRLSFFSTLATLGTPCDITLQELRVECLFPADSYTAESMEQRFWEDGAR